MRRMLSKKAALPFVITSALLFSASAFAVTPPSDPDPDPTPCEGDCDFTRGPDPTESMLEARSGPFNVDTVNVSSRVSGFGGGTIHYPTNTTGKMGAIVVAPGFVSPESSIAWWGPQLASHGFIVMTIATNSLYDQPDARRDQIEAGLDYLISQSNSSSSDISGMVDSNRLGAMGWSMGGGGTLQLASGNRLSAAIPLAPYNSSRNNFDQIRTPTLIFACENDSVAAVRSHASPFYNDIPNSTDKAFVEINGGAHSCANGGNTNNSLLSKYGVSWMKLHIDQDQRYNQFLCGPNHESDRSISEYRGTCPY